jgi:AcrR family transcriptional regulator
MRVDARRNYDRLLSEADATFREHGTDSALEGIARRAGVAVGTLYGHFPTRRALVGAVLRERNDELFALGEELLAEADPERALREWIAAVVAHAATYRGLATLLADGIDDAASELHASCARMADIGDRVLARALQAGAVRPDVTGTDVLAIMNAVAWTREHTSPGQADRLLAFSVAGLLSPVR